MLNDAIASGDEMALARCPECKEDVSTQAQACPHCGCPGPFDEIASSNQSAAVGSESLTKSPDASFLITSRSKATVVSGPEDYHIESTYVSGGAEKRPDRLDLLMSWWKRLPLWGKVAIILVAVGFVGNMIGTSAIRDKKPAPLCKDSVPCALEHIRRHPNVVAARLEKDGSALIVTMSGTPDDWSDEQKKKMLAVFDAMFIIGRRADGIPNAGDVTVLLITHDAQTQSDQPLFACGLGRFGGPQTLDVPCDIPELSRP